MIRPEDIVTYPSPVGPAEPMERRPLVSLEVPRRSVLRGIVGLGTILGLRMVGIFPAAREALAQSGYDWYPYGGPYCPTSGSSEYYRCDGGCHPSWWICGGVEWGYCCDGAGWHRNDWPYTLAQNTCGGPYEGWTWRAPSFCWGGGWVWYWDCHDGYNHGSGTPYLEICKTGWGYEV